MIAKIKYICPMSNHQQHDSAFWNRSTPCYKNYSNFLEFYFSMLLFVWRM